MNKTAKAVALLGAVAFGLTACASKPTTSGQAGGGGGATKGGNQSSSAPAPDNSSFKACMVSDTGGFNDKSFNQTSHDGLVTAKRDFGISTAQIQSLSASDYNNNLNAMVQAKCNIVITVGYTLGAATEAAAQKNPNIDFAIVDNAYDKPVKNLKGLVFNTAQPAFLGGYLAAGMSQTGIVGTFGGEKLPTVTIYMDGFYDGVQYYNQQNHKGVQVIGWNEKTQNGTFTNDFSTKIKGQTTAQNMIQQGADVIFPVAGGDGLGALQAAKDSSGKVNAIWVDTDGCVSAAEYCSVLMSSAEKGMQVAVKTAIEESMKSQFTNAPYVGTLRNKGVSLAPFHDFSSKIPSTLKTQLNQVKAGLLSGKIKIASPSLP